jgi:hypothetical protein
VSRVAIAAVLVASAFAGGCAALLGADFDGATLGDGGADGMPEADPGSLDGSSSAVADTSLETTADAPLDTGADASADAPLDGGDASLDASLDGPDGSVCPTGMVRLSGGTLRSSSVAPFCIDKDLVSKADYAQCVGAATCTAADTQPNCNARVSGRDNHPINCVTWAQASAYCTSLGKRLPSDNEWRWAVTGGIETIIYPWGSSVDPTPDDQPPYMCWNNIRIDGGIADRTQGWPAESSGTCAIGSYPRGNTPTGIRDLTGNVEEWLSSSITPWAHQGAWINNSANVFNTTSFEDGGNYGQHPEEFGFRCAKGL